MFFPLPKLTQFTSNLLPHKGPFFIHNLLSALLHADTFIICAHRVRASKWTTVFPAGCPAETCPFQRLMGV